MQTIVLINQKKVELARITYAINIGAGLNKLNKKILSLR